MSDEKILNKKLDVIRKVWELDKPSYGCLPEWFSKNMPIDLIPCSINDHFGTVKTNQGDVAIFEPYEKSCNTGLAVALAECIAEHINCAFYVSLQSYWYPGRTIRIAFYQNKEPS